MNSRTLTATLILLGGFALIFVLGANGITNQRAINFTSWLKSTPDENLEKLETKIEMLENNTIHEPIDSNSRAVVPGDTIRVNYRGWLAATGVIFDQSYNSGDNGFVFTVGQGVIEGWSQGVVGMKVGEVRRLKIPSSLGYGEAGNTDVIPPNADLMFDVELMQFESV